MDSQGDEIRFNVTSSENWTARSSNAWCIVSPNSGEGSGTAASVTLRVSPNSEHSPRTCTVTVTSGELSARIEVTQGEMNALLIDQKEFTLTSAAQSLSIDLNSTTLVSAIVSDDAKDWISVQETKSMSPRSVLLSVSCNETFDSRTGVVTVKGETGLEESVKIVQTQKHAIIMNDHEYEFDGNEHSLDIPFQASFDDYEIRVSDDAVDWIIPMTEDTKAMHDAHVMFIIKANPSGDEGRHGMIMITDKSDEVCECVTVIQSASELMGPRVDVLMLSGEEQAFTVPFVSTKPFDYQVTEGESWLSRLDTKSTVYYDLPFAVRANISDVSRVGTVKFVSDDHGMTNKIDIRQLPLGKGVITIESEGTSYPGITYPDNAMWQYHWDDGSVSQINEPEWRMFDDAGKHVTKVLIDSPGEIRIVPTGVKVIDLRQF